jgi:hypothetical protein
MVLCAETHRLISVMLGTLRMDIDTCINEYIDMAPEIFPVENIVSGSTLGKLVKVAKGKHRFDPTPLEMAVKRLVQKHLGPKAAGGEDTLFKFEASRDHLMPQCKVYVIQPLTLRLS